MRHRWVLLTHIDLTLPLHSHVWLVCLDPVLLLLVSYYLVYGVPVDQSILHAAFDVISELICMSLFACLTCSH